MRDLHFVLKVINGGRDELLEKIIKLEKSAKIKGSRETIAILNMDDVAALSRQPAFQIEWQKEAVGHETHQGSRKITRQTLFLPCSFCWRSSSRIRISRASALASRRCAKRASA